MVDKQQPKHIPQSTDPPLYQIRLKGHLDLQYTERFAGLTISLEEQGETLLTGPILDQAELYGVLKRVRDLGIPLISLIPLNTHEPSKSQAK